MLAKVAMLYIYLFKVCRNGVLPNIKLVQCLQKMHMAKPIVDSKEHVTVWSPNAGGLIRMVAGKFREIKMSPEKLSRCLSKVFRSYA